MIILFKTKAFYEEKQQIGKLNYGLPFLFFFKDG